MSHPHWHTLFWTKRLPIYEAALEQLPKRRAVTAAPPTPPPSLVFDRTQQSEQPTRAAQHSSAKRKRRTSHGSRSDSEENEAPEPAAVSPLAHQPSDWVLEFSKRLANECGPARREHQRLCRLAVQKQTSAALEAGQYLLPDGTSVHLPDSPVATYPFTYSPAASAVPSGHRRNRILVRNTDCLEEAMRLKSQGLQRVALLNMANATQPGGGWKGGAGAQEENCHRRTNLCEFLMDTSGGAWRNHGRPCYPIARGDKVPLELGVLYSPAVCVFRGPESDGYPFMQQPFFVDVISCAATRRPILDGERLVPTEEVKLKAKIKALLQLAKTHRIQALVLSALGCGAFKNPPAHVAQLFKTELLGEFDGEFESVVFAILEDNNSHQMHNLEGNLKPFQREFES